jgi:hypothetical protein
MHQSEWWRRLSLMPILASGRGTRTFINIEDTAACVPLCKGCTKQPVGVGTWREGLVAQGVRYDTGTGGLVRAGPALLEQNAARQRHRPKPAHNNAVLTSAASIACSVLSALGKKSSPACPVQLITVQLWLLSHAFRYDLGPHVDCTHAFSPIPSCVLPNRYH